MSQEIQFTYPSGDRVTEIHAVMWIPDGPVRGILQIAHGMMEFVERYGEFARFLNRHGILAVGNDHLGHGGSVRSEAYYGYFAEKNGNKILLSDMRELQRMTQEKYPNLPCFLLGHSMGSFLARQYLCQYGNYLDGAIICGTAWHSGLEARAGMFLCRLIARGKGWRYRSRLVNRLAIGSFNRKFHPARTPLDWLSSDEEAVDRYRSDPRTQFVFTVNAYEQMFAGLKYLSDSKNLARMPKNLPVLFAAGEEDPVGNFGLGVKKTAVAFRAAGMKNVTCRLYPNDRHEILNERNRREVFQDILGWMESTGALKE